MRDLSDIFAICSEFADEYGVDTEDGETVVVYMKSEYINELRAILAKKEYKLHSFKVYGDDALIHFVPNNRKEFDEDI